MKRITAILLFSVTALGACGASGTAPVSNTPATISPPVTLPDLNDPAIRQRFVCSFAPGSFGICTRWPRPWMLSATITTRRGRRP